MSLESIMPEGAIALSGPPTVEVGLTLIPHLYKIDIYEGVLHTGTWYKWGLERAKRKASYVLLRYVREKYNRDLPPIVSYESHYQGEN